VKYLEIIGDNLSKAGWSWGCVATVDREGRTIYIADAHRDDIGPNAMCRPKSRSGVEQRAGHNRGDDLPADDTQLPSVGL
jgi:hypothetical protein